MMTPSPIYGIHSRKHLARQDFLDRAIARSLDWAGQYPALSYAAHDSQSLSNGRQVVAAAISSTGVRCVFFSAIGSVLDFTATRDELGRAKTWWYFVQR